MSECIGISFLENSIFKQSEEFSDDFLYLESYIYEVMRVFQGTPLFAEDHIERLLQTFALNNISITYSAEEIYQQIKTLININKLDLGNIKIVYTDDKMKNDSHFLIYITPHDYPSEKDYEVGVCVRLHSGIRHNPNAKVMIPALREEANLIKSNQNCYEVLLVDNDGFITEGSRSNVFFVKDNTVYTPPLSDVLPGITRKHIISGCSQNSISVVEKKIAMNDIMEYDAVFISGTSRKVLPVNHIDDKMFSVNNTIMRKIQQNFNEQISEYINSKKQAIF